MRKMATIRKIDSLRAIPGADAIECAVVGGWTCVVKKGEYQAGDLAIYCEIDSFIPTAVAPFLTRPGHYPKTFEGVEGERLRSVKLRGQLSQGLLLSLSILPNGLQFEGEDVSEALGIVKYEPPVPAALAGEVQGLFPSRIPKTDQERIQNLTVELEEWKAEGLTWEVTEKLDGSSMTVYSLDGVIGVCSRNLDLKRNPDNSLWKAAIKNGLEEKLASLDYNIAIQGELIGYGVQGNMYKMHDQDFYVYDVYDVDAGRYFTPAEREGLIEQLNLKHCPILYREFSLGSMSVHDILKFAEGKSIVGTGVEPEREGLVFKCTTRDGSFKVISNRFLTKNDR